MKFENFIENYGDISNREYELMEQAWLNGYKEGYDNGYEHAKMYVEEHNYQTGYDDGYEQGLEDARWNDEEGEF